MSILKQWSGAYTEARFLLFILPIKNKLIKLINAFEVMGDSYHVNSLQQSDLIKKVGVFKGYIIWSTRLAAFVMIFTLQLKSTK